MRVWQVIQDELEWIGDRCGTLLLILGGTLLLAAGPLAIIGAHRSVVAQLIGLHR